MRVHLLRDHACISRHDHRIDDYWLHARQGWDPQCWDCNDGNYCIFSVWCSEQRRLTQHLKDTMDSDFKVIATIRDVYMVMKAVSWCNGVWISLESLVSKSYRIVVPLLCCYPLIFFMLMGINYSITLMPQARNSAFTLQTVTLILPSSCARIPFTSQLDSIQLFQSILNKLQSCIHITR